MSDPPRDAPPTGAALSECIVAVARARDFAAFTTVFLHFAPRLKAYFLRLRANQGVAEDLAQETLLAVWRNAALFDPRKAGASTWIYTIARNLRFNAVRRERPVTSAKIEVPSPSSDQSPSRMRKKGFPEPVSICSLSR
jgi:RNA polymerase sigma-70 factor (ECF subfamily)